MSIARPMILATAELPAQSEPGLPRVAELELAKRLPAKLLHYGDVSVSAGRRRVEQRLRLDVSLARAGLSGLNGQNVILSTSERVGLPLLALQRGKGAVPHIMLAHHLLSPTKYRLVKLSGLLRKLTLLLCLSQHELCILRRECGLPPERVALIRGVCADHRFFLPAPGLGDGYVLATGATQRDYTMLMRALGGRPVRVLVAAGSQWVEGPAVRGEIPANFTFLPKQSLPEMRELYARSAVVAIPLRRGSQYSAGRTNVAEAMASAKPVVATDLAGMRDYLEHGKNGLLVEEGNEAAFRAAVMGLLGEETSARTMGLAGRKLAEEKWNLEVYVDFLCRVLGEVAATGGAPALARAR